MPNDTAKHGVHIHDVTDSKRTMIMVVIALIPALLFGMWNIGYQHFLAIGQDATFWQQFAFGLLAMLPAIVVSYLVGLITAEVPSVNRVCYELTKKPVATIEFE